MASTDPLARNVHAIVELERQAIHQRSRLDRFADAVTGFAGSGRFIVGHFVWFGFWIVVNRGAAAFDSFPFSLLNVLVSLEAVFLTTFVLMTQNRMSKQADRRAHLDLQVNLLAEQELTAILKMLQALCHKTGTNARITDARIEQLLQDTDVVQLAKTLDEELEPGGGR